MYSLLALACWIGGLVLLPITPGGGAGLAAAGVLAAGAAMRRPDDLETLLGLLLLAALVTGALALVFP